VAPWFFLRQNGWWLDVTPRVACCQLLTRTRIFYVGVLSGCHRARMAGRAAAAHGGEEELYLIRRYIIHRHTDTDLGRLAAPILCRGIYLPISLMPSAGLGAPLSSPSPAYMCLRCAYQCRASRQIHDAHARTLRTLHATAGRPAAAAAEGDAAYRAPRAIPSIYLSADRLLCVTANGRRTACTLDGLGLRGAHLPLAPASPPLAFARLR